jgi:hypothetical protein
MASRKKTPSRKPSKPARPRKPKAAKARRPAAKPAAKTRPARPAPPARAGAARPTAPARPAAPAKAAAPAKPAPPAAKVAPGKGGKPGLAAVPAPPPPGKMPPPARPKKGGRKSALQRRPGFVPGDLLLPGGPQGDDELQYFFRGCSAAAHASVDAGVDEALAKRGATESAEARAEAARHAKAMTERFGSGNIDGLLPNRPARRPIFAGVIERAKHRRREIGAFLRGLDIGRTETSHMDSHGEASLQSLMEWAARLENLVEADEPEQADYAQFHRGLDQLDNTTEALIVDVELTLRRLRDRVRA